MKELCRERGRVSLKQLIGIARLCVVCRCSGLEIVWAWAYKQPSAKHRQTPHKLPFTLYLFLISQYIKLCLITKYVCTVCLFHLHVKGVSFSLELGCFVFVLLSLYEDLLKSLHLLSFRRDVLHLPRLLHTYTTDKQVFLTVALTTSRILHG